MTLNQLARFVSVAGVPERFVSASRSPRFNRKLACTFYITMELSTRTRRTRGSLTCFVIILCLLVLSNACINPVVAFSVHHLLQQQLQPSSLLHLRDRSRSSRALGASARGAGMEKRQRRKDGGQLISKLGTLSRNNHEEKWRSKFELLQEFKIMNGHCRVPKSFVTSGNVKLGKWVKTQ